MRSTQKITTPTFFWERNNAGNTGDATVIFRTKDKVTNVRSESDPYSQVDSIFDNNNLVKQYLDSEYLLVNIYNSGDVEFIGRSLSLCYTLRLNIEKNNENNKQDKVNMQVVFYKIHQSDFIKSGKHDIKEGDTIYQTAMRIVNHCTAHEILEGSSESVRLKGHYFDENEKGVTLKSFRNRLAELKLNEMNKADIREKVAMETLDQEHRDQYHVDETDRPRAACMIL